MLYIQRFIARSVIWVIIIYPTEEDGSLVENYLIQYSFTGEEHPIAPKLHKNAK